MNGPVLSHFTVDRDDVMGTVSGWWAERAETRPDRIGCEGEAETDADRGVVRRSAWQLHCAVLAVNTPQCSHTVH